MTRPRFREIPGWNRTFPPGCYVSDDGYAAVEWDKNERVWWLWKNDTLGSFNSGKRVASFRSRNAAMRYYNFNKGVTTPTAESEWASTD